MSLYEKGNGIKKLVFKKNKRTTSKSSNGQETKIWILTQDMVKWTPLPYKNYLSIPKQKRSRGNGTNQFEEEIVIEDNHLLLLI